MKLILYHQPQTLESSTDQEMVCQALTDRWGSTQIASRDRLIDASRLSRILAKDVDGTLVGLLTYDLAERSCEIVTLDALVEGCGIGRLLVEEAANRSRLLGCRRLSLITTNNNLGAQGFYARLGFRLVRVDEGAVDRARKLKPSIPLVDDTGAPIRDELEYELELTKL